MAKKRVFGDAWIGPDAGYNEPRQLKWWLEHCQDDDFVWPGGKGVYIVTGKKWIGEPTAKSDVWYVGTVRADSFRLCTRMGDLIADTFGFFQEENGHHSGGQSIWHRCLKEKVHPFKLWLGWKRWVHNPIETEKRILKELGGSRCNIHHNADR